MNEPLDLLGYQARPLVFRIYLGDSSQKELSAEILYKILRGNDEIFQTYPLRLRLTEKSVSQAQKLTYYYAGIVSYAILRPPPATCASAIPEGDDALPVIVGLHGAGVKADSVQVREMLDAAYGTCAWVLSPSGVTPWSGDDWREFVVFLILNPLCRPRTSCSTLHGSAAFPAYAFHSHDHMDTLLSTS
jgi:hypothetical protein